MKIIQAMMTKNPCYTAGQKIKVQGLMLHSVGTPQPNAQAFIKNWNTPSYHRACVHAFIDGNSENIYQCLPWNHRAWHCGGSGNATHIGIEMCEPSCIKYIRGATFTCSDIVTAKVVVKRTYQAAVELFAYLCKQYNLNPFTDICSHKEGCAKGIASNHGDPEHLWNQLKLPYTMDGFRKDVKKAMDGDKVVSPSSESKRNTPFRVRVDIANLNIRKGAGTNTATTGKYTGIGVFTITEVKSGKGSVKGWGKLQSGVGWISLDYARKLE